jgi:hypothetical protein
MTPSVHEQGNEGNSLVSELAPAFEARLRAQAWPRALDRNGIWGLAVQNLFREASG